VPKSTNKLGHITASEPVQGRMFGNNWHLGGSNINQKCQTTEEKSK